MFESFETYASRSLRANRRPGTLSQLVSNLRGGIELACLRPVDRDRFYGSLEQVALLSAMNLLLACIGQALLTDAPREFYAGGLAVQGLWLLSVPMLAILVSREASSLDSVAQVTAAMLLAPLFTGWVFFAGFELACVYTHVLVQALEIPRRRLVSMSLTYCLAVGASFSALPPSFVWYTDYIEPETTRIEPPRLDVESILYHQHEQLAKQLALLEPERPGMTDVYFVGFASYSKQNVFKKEVEYVRDLFDRRFSTRGHSILLVNHRDTVDSLPIASVSNLSATLEGLSRIMNPAEDILVLYMTSHGSKNHKLSVNFPRFPLNQLDPFTVARLFESNGIEWPVTVISACYSGGFIEPLQHERSMVVTSAASDRTSFGCSDDADLTYFARAYFEEQLEHTRDFERAFENARTRVTEWELAKDYTPSNPQIHVGEEMAERIRMLASTIDNESALAMEVARDAEIANREN